MEHEDKILMVGSTVFIIGGTLFCSGVVSSGLITGCLGFISTAFLLLKVKAHAPRLWNAIIKYNIISDLVISGVLILVIGTSTATAIVGGSTAAILTSFGLYYYTRQINHII